MAIAKMKKLTLIGLSREKEALIKELMSLGVVQISEQDARLSDESWSNVVRKDDAETASVKWETELERVDNALKLIDRFGDSKKPLISERKAIQTQEFEDALVKEYEIRRDVLKLTRLSRKLAHVLLAENRANIARMSLLPWKEYDIPAEQFATKATRVWQGVVPAGNDSADFLRILADKTQYTDAEVVHTDSEQHYISILFLAEELDTVQAALRDLGFNRIALPMAEGAVGEALAEVEQELADIDAQKEELIEKIRELKDCEPTLKLYHDELVMRRDCAAIRDKFLVTDSTFYLDGWFPRIAEDKLKALLSRHTCYFETADPGQDEQPPVLLLNGKLAEPFEAVTKLYSFPDYWGIDATAFFALPYALFFGMMLSDAAYGLLLMGITYFVKKKFTLEGMTKQLIDMFFYCGVFTLFWGLMFGSFFGDLITVVSSTFFGRTINFPTLWFNPVEEPMTLLIFSYALGLLHILLAMGLGGYMSIRDGQPLDALFDVGFWYMLIIGLLLFMGAGMVPALPAAATVIGKWMSIAGTLGIILTAGRHNKGIARITGGFTSLYGITGYLSDVLSYSRLLALGLATGVISSVFNTLGALGGPTLAGVILMIVAFSIGHPYNFAINALGSFVHSCRLQYVEFFGKFYQSGGVGFAPFCENTKYFKIIKEEQ